MRPLNELLPLIEDNDLNYDERYHLVIEAVLRAISIGMPAGFRIDPDEPEWPCAYIELPTGQVNWHLPQHPVAWDGHSTEEKYQRIRRFVEEVR